MVRFWPKEDLNLDFVAALLTHAMVWLQLCQSTSDVSMMKLVKMANRFILHMLTLHYDLFF